VPPALKESDAQDTEAIAYIRLTETGPSREEQDGAIRHAAEAAALTIADTVVEVAAIGEGDIVDRRMGLFELLGAAQAGKIKTVVVSGWNAISDQPLEAALIALMLAKSGVRTVFADGFDIEPHRQAAQKIARLTG